MKNNISFETFKTLSSYYIDQIKQDEPSSFNGNIEFRKYKVTIELIDEPLEVLEERLQTMWDHCGIYHHWKPLREAAKSIGYELKLLPNNKRNT